MMGSPDGRCTCDPATARRYARRISGPLLDRIDLQVDVPRVPYSELAAAAEPEASAPVRERVLQAREVAARRAGKPGAVNADLPDEALGRACRLGTRAEALLGREAERLRLSARACRRILRVARTVADLGGAGRIGSEHVLEALRYRALERAAGA